MYSVFDAFRLDTKVAIITGGARDLGYDMAEALAEAGSHLIITSRDLSRAQASADKLRANFPIDVLPLALDQRTFSQIEEMGRAAQDWKGHIDILINNAGGGSGQGATHLFDRPTEVIADMISTNLIGMLHCCQVVGQVMAQRKQGKIINVASIAGLVGRDRRMYTRTGKNGQPVDYAAAKAGVIGMTKDLAGLLGPMGIHVNSISPGGFSRQLSEDFVQAYSDRTPLGRMGRDGIDLKGAALFLASPASDYVHGHNLVVDGGFSIWQ